MKLRTVTINLPNKPNFKLLARPIKKLMALMSTMYAVRTFRLNLYPDTPLSYLKEINLFCEENNITWFCYSTRKPDQSKILNILKKYDRAFVSVIEYGNNIKNIAQIKKAIGRLNGGFDNFRFGVSFNTKPDAPFFPFTYSSGMFGFSIGLELVPELKKTDVQIIKQLEELDKSARLCAKESKIHYDGVDLSLAPYKDHKSNSVADLYKAYGKYGTIAITKKLTDRITCLAAYVKTVGFNGVMHSLLEDPGDVNRMTIPHMIANSAVCGCGIDMVPISMHTPNHIITNIINDVKAVSDKYKKPLGVRLVLVPQKRKEMTKFKHDFLVNKKVIR